MKYSITPSESWQIFQALEAGLTNALQDPSQSEAQLVANMVYHIPREINALSFANIRCGGVFVHGQPFVKCEDFPEGTPRSVEIGDLLLLRTEKCGDTIHSRRALLLQAKKHSSLPVKPDNMNQHHLYATWPTYEYVRSTSALNGKKRHITGPDLHNATKYLLIVGRRSADHRHHKFCRCRFLPFYCSEALTAHPTFPELSHYGCFVSELHEFLLDNAGKRFQSPPPDRKRNWDRTIHDLIETTAERTSRFIGRVPGVTSASRGQCLCFFSGGELGRTTSLVTGGGSNYECEFGGPPVVPDEVPQDKGDQGAISIIEFEISMDEKECEKYEVE